MSGLRKRSLHGFGIAVMIVERDIAGHIVVELWRAIARAGFGRDDGGERLDIDGDRFGGIFRLRHRLGDDASDRVADIAHFVGRQRFAPRLFQWCAVPVVERHDAFEGAVTFQLGAAVDAEHARHFSRRLQIDAADDAVGVPAADHHHIGLTREADVVGIAAFAA